MVCENFMFIYVLLHMHKNIQMYENYHLLVVFDNQQGKLFVFGQLGRGHAVKIGQCLQLL